MQFKGPNTTFTLKINFLSPLPLNLVTACRHLRQIIWKRSKIKSDVHWLTKSLKLISKCNSKNTNQKLLKVRKSHKMKFLPSILQKNLLPIT